MKNLFVWLSIVSLMAVSCSKKESADLVIVNGKIFTNDNELPYTEAVAIKGEKIILTGKSEEVRQLIDKEHTKVIDAEGRLVLPGFNDAHVHFGPL
ncbi:MAG TPA: hypothetical protein VHO68_06125, partial [Bacteroidales bacterium]|nr:hypothetical protein [Bacteroidales bacterium]